jgi:hypothetical protein
MINLGEAGEGMTGHASVSMYRRAFRRSGALFAAVAGRRVRPERAAASVAGSRRVPDDDD